MSFDHFGAFMASIGTFIAAHERQADRRWLLELIGGSSELLSLSAFPRMEPMFAKYDDADPEMKALLERAATVYADAAVAAATWALAGWAIEDAQRSSRAD